MTFDWVPTSSEERAPLIDSVRPKDVLYGLDDEPIIFTSISSRFPVLCFKIDEAPPLGEYIVVPTNDDLVEKLRDGKISLRSAISQPWAWVIQATADFVTKRSWGISSSSLPDEILPKAGLGLDPAHGPIIERTASIEDPFLSIKFRGGDLQNGTIPFSVIKSCVDEVYNSVWRIFAPAMQRAARRVHEKTLRRVFNLPTHEFVHASLLIVFDRPTVDISGFRDKPDVDVQAARQNIEKSHIAFLDSAEAMAKAIDVGRLTKGFVENHLDAVEAVAKLVPSQNSFFDGLEIRGRRQKKLTAPLVINAQNGSIIKEIYQDVMFSTRTINGTVKIVNDTGHKFTIVTEAFRKVTCQATSDDQRHAIGLLRPDMKISVTGDFAQRTQRDLLILEKFTVDGKTIV